MARHLLLTVLLAVPSLAQEGSDADTPAARSGQENSTIHKPGPQYFALRYNEDWGYLEEAAGTYEQDIFDPLKNVDLGGDWRLDIGGSTRLRMMAETNKPFRAPSITQDTFPLQQYLLHANLRYNHVPRSAVGRRLSAVRCCGLTRGAALTVLDSSIAPTSGTSMHSMCALFLCTDGRKLTPKKRSAFSLMAESSELKAERGS